MLVACAKSRLKYRKVDIYGINRQFFWYLRYDPVYFDSTIEVVIYFDE